MQPFRIPPAVGQFPHDSGGGAFNEFAFGFVHNGGIGRIDSCDVLQKEHSRIAIIGKVNDFEDEPRPRAVEPGLLAGDADVLARESRNDAIHQSTKAASVDSSQIAAPDWRWSQGLLFHACKYDAGCIGVPFSVGNRPAFDSKKLKSGVNAFIEHPDA